MIASAELSLPANFRRIRLELAREPRHPEGDTHIGYSLLAPLDKDNRLDIETYGAYRRECRVIRFHSGRDHEHGYLLRRPGGSWAFHYEFDDGAEDDDPAYRLADHRFAYGEYVTIEEDEGTHTYRVTRVEPL